MWSALHEDTRLTVRESEVHYFRMVALAADDDLVSCLLLSKLRLARADAAPAPGRLVVMNSFLEYRFDGGERRFGQIVHPSAFAPAYGISVVSLIGAGLIGLEAGQTILWPDASGTLCDLHVAHVENCPGLSDWLGFSSEASAAAQPAPRRPRAAGRSLPFGS